jgi:lysyl-tRNA synthetase class 2
MDPVERAQFLGSQWKSFASFRRDKTLTVSELMAALETKPRGFDLAAKLVAVAPEQGWLAIGSQGQTWRLLATGPWPVVAIHDGRADGRQVLRAGDSVCLRLADCSWSQAGEHLLEVQLDRIELLSPARDEFTLAPDYWQSAQQWSQFLTGVRRFFTLRGCREVWTPSLVKCPGLEPTLDPLPVRVTNQSGQSSQLFLPTSPELHLKKLLAQGAGDVFEIKECFRDGEVTDHHQPEFWMLEWYRAFADLSMIANDLQDLLRELHQQGIFPSPAGPLRQLTMAEVFQRCLGFTLTPTTTRSELVALCEAIHLPTNPSDSWDDVFHLLFIAKVEPQLAEWGPTLITHFPPSQRALARLTADGWADRFEFYWQGLEIANAFNELNDPDEQLARCQADNQDRVRRGKAELPIDEDFIRALRAGMPPSAGVALGLERLLMAGLGLTNIRKLRAFAFNGGSSR